MFVLIECINKYVVLHSYYRYLENTMTLRRKHLYKRPAQTADTEVRTKSRNDLRLFNTTEEFDRYIKYFNKRTILLGRNIDPTFMSNFGLEAIFDRIGWTPVVSLVELVYTQLV